MSDPDYCDHSFNDNGECEYCGLTEQDWDASEGTIGTYQ